MCMVDDSDGLVTVLRESTPMARKEHRCDECGRGICVGERYLNEGILWQGEKNTHKTCAHCQQVRSWLLTECGGWVFSGLREDINEHALEGYGFGVLRLSAGIRRKWKRKDGRLWPIPKPVKTSLGPLA